MSRLAELFKNGKSLPIKIVSNICKAITWLSNPQKRLTINLII